MASYEEEIKKNLENGKELPKKLKLSMIKYFWQANPMTRQKFDTIPKFLRYLDIFKNFTDNELRILSKSLHMRSFSNREVIFSENDVGVGFYLIYSGYVDMFVEAFQATEGSISNEREPGYLLTLEKGDYFGELALLQEKNMRNASAISREGCVLLGLFKPDVEDLIRAQPMIVTKFLQSISLIIANRLFFLTKEVKELNYKLSQLEKEKNG